MDNIGNDELLVGKRQEMETKEEIFLSAIT